MCAGYFAARGETGSTWGEAFSFDEKINKGNLIVYDGSEKTITLKKGHSYSMFFSGSVAIEAKKENIIGGVALVDGYDSSACMMTTRTSLYFSATGQENRLIVAYNTVYTASDDIKLQFSYNNLLYQDTILNGGKYSITIIALD